MLRNIFSLCTSSHYLGGFQEICRCVLTGDASTISVAIKKNCYPVPTAHFSYLCATVTGTVRPWLYGLYCCCCCCSLLYYCCTAGCRLLSQNGATESSPYACFIPGTWYRYHISTRMMFTACLWYWMHGNHAIVLLCSHA